ncbi:hypothetical protein N185_15990 [Sinorhizobium sp. GW3]|nr:hypothetical protein N185_15990 [Sinorhizobium sp. GW3]
MPVAITVIDGIVSGIGIPIGADTRLCWIPVVRRDEPTELRIVVSCVEILQPGFGIEALADIALLRAHRRIGRLAIGGIAVLLDQIAAGVGDLPDRRQMVAVQEVALVEPVWATELIFKSGCG